MSGTGFMKHPCQHIEVFVFSSALFSCSLVSVLNKSPNNPLNPFFIGASFGWYQLFSHLDLGSLLFVIHLT